MEDDSSKYLTLLELEYFLNLEQPNVSTNNKSVKFKLIKQYGERVVNRGKIVGGAKNFGEKVEGKIIMWGSRSFTLEEEEIWRMIPLPLKTVQAERVRGMLMIIKVKMKLKRDNNEEVIDDYNEGKE